MTSQRVDFDFLIKDIETQKQVANSAIQAAKRLREKQKNNEPVDDSDVRLAIETLLNLAEKLTANSSTTSSLATNAISVLSEKFRA